ncbi:hypothetical protein [Enterococcus rivorum]|uniref:Uncharacterized protein n=1 Tax=Enterococcus rivorum TaxID=762845 RepID=A0A1E5L069_9ENTE|nr:hypothetical protein [Enterococcus rivorum]MBP2098831.1 hypothetical protein [Enterococcus rivorum]OEH83562.1 hypothetical protein BCR26_08770 [Enterococcus rivorum]
MENKLEVLLENGWELRIIATTTHVTIELYCIDSDETFDTILLSNISAIPLKELIAHANNLAENIPNYYYHMIELLNTIKAKEEQTLYRIQVEDIEEVVSDKKNLDTLIDKFTRGFSCLEDVQFFIQFAEDDINRERRNQLKEQLERRERANFN